MTQLTVTVLQLGLLVLLWLFVLGVVAVLRRDLFGTRAAAPVAPAPAAAPGPARQAPPAQQPPQRQQPAPQRQQPAPPRAAAPRRLVVVEGPLTGTSVDLADQPVLLGRAPDCTLVLGDDYASGHHARLVPGRGGSWQLEDLGSTNGTTLGRGPGGTPVRGTVPVEVGSVVRIGRTSLELRA